MSDSRNAAAYFGLSSISFPAHANLSPKRWIGIGYPAGRGDRRVAAHDHQNLAMRLVNP